MVVVLQNFPNDVSNKDVSMEKSSLKRLRRYIYMTILFLSLSSALYSIKAAKDDNLRMWSEKVFQQPEKTITRVLRRMTLDKLDDNKDTTTASITTATTAATNTTTVATTTTLVPQVSSHNPPAFTRRTPALLSAKQPTSPSVFQVEKTSTSPQPSKTVPTDTTPMPCEPPAYHEFPEDLFSNKQRAQGFVVIHVLVGIYMFYALAVVCDDYFVASMDKICQKLGLSEDVAGATFMAAGSSAPELFASLLGVFVAKGDVGTGTIIGSAVFNVLFVIGICALFAGQIVALSWWPLLRDSFYYSMTVVVLIAILADSIVTWWESLIMLILYAVYIIMMMYNEKIKMWLSTKTKLGIMDDLTQASRGILSDGDKHIGSSYVQFTNENEGKYESSKQPEETNKLTVDEMMREFPRKMTLYDAALKVMTSQYFSPRTRFRCACKRIIIETRYLRGEGKNFSFVTVNCKASDFKTKDSMPTESWMRTPSLADQGLLPVVKWVITIPVLATLHYTVPDCRDARWERWFLLTFFAAMLWIAFFSYILVWMVTLVGYTCGIPDTIMGITFLAAGTSIPDAYSSLLVAKQGMGDMAISNSIGSNVFDILIGLALPWFLQTGIINPNSKIQISSRGMVYNVILLFLSIAATLVSVHYCRWQLNKRLGVLLLVFYCIFLIFSLLIEYNIFGMVNLPECEV